MPRENKKRRRGPRSEKKRKLEGAEENEPENKRQRHDDDPEQEEHFIPLDALQFQDSHDFSGALSGPGEMPYFGQLEEEEREYFKRANEMLELNQFSDPEERALFLNNVYQEADGKELKMATNFACSKLMERLILLATPAQLKSLFQVFSGHFLNLIQHVFGSHCCEALFVQAAPVVSREFSNSAHKHTGTNGDTESSMEGLFLETLGELEGHLGYLMTDRYASHTLRVLLMVLSGEPLERPSTKSILSSKRKERIVVNGQDQENSSSLQKRNVPETFITALGRLITESVSGLDTIYLRGLATHQTGNPTLQLLLTLELTKFGKQRARDEDSIIRKLLPDDPIAQGNESAKFVTGLLYDPVGSRLLEAIVENAPGKMFKSLYREFLKERMPNMARNEIASYVATKIMERLGKDDLDEVMRSLCDQIPSLVERGRFAIVKSLIERCLVRNVETKRIAQALESAYSGPKGFEIARLLKLGEAVPEDGSKSEHQAHPEKVHGSLLAQAMLTDPGSLSSMIFEALIRLGPALSLKTAKDPSASRTVQAALTSPNATIIARRKIIQHFYGNVGEMALDPAASHVIDAIWRGTHGLAFIRERIAEELAENEPALRESIVGRAVWRNWKMDLYKRKRAEWVQQSRVSAGSDGFQPFPDTNGDVKKTKRSAIELARARHAADKAKKEKFSEKSKGKKPAIAGEAT